MTMTMHDARDIVVGNYETDAAFDSAMEDGTFDLDAHALINAWDRATRVTTEDYADACEAFSDSDRDAWRDDSAFAFSLERGAQYLHDLADE